MLKRLTETSWFVDANFSIVPSIYKQLLTILTYNSQAQTYVPAAFILMTGKQETLYRTAFSALTTVCKSHKINIEPKNIMTEFETGMRNALIANYPTATLLGCYFHYCRCLWTYAAKNGLKVSERITTTKKIIALLKILPHVNILERKAIFSELKDSFKNQHKMFKDFLAYYEKNWLNKYSIDFETIETNDRLVRTNNVCEQYNRRLTQKIKIKNPRLAILISNLIEEDLFKKKVIGSLSQQNEEIFINHCSVSRDQALPFSMIIDILSQAKKQRYNFRNILSDQNLQTKLIDICQKCEEFLYPKLKSQTEIDNEQDSNKGNYKPYYL